MEVTVEKMIAKGIKSKDMKKIVKKTSTPEKGGKDKVRLTKCFMITSTGAVLPKEEYYEMVRNSHA